LRAAAPPAAGKNPVQRGKDNACHAA